MFKVYSKDNCTQCDQAKLVLDLKGFPYEIKKLGIDFSIEDAKALGRSSFPIIFKDDVLIGGLMELRKAI